MKGKLVFLIKHQGQYRLNDSIIRIGISQNGRSCYWPWR